MEENSTIISGFGGQGVILAGKSLARSGMEIGLEVTWLPSYGAEMRGGTANCTVILSSSLISSPIVDNPDTLIAFNKPSLDKFGFNVKESGQIIFNDSLIDEPDFRNDINYLGVKLNDLANELGNKKVINMVALGVWARLTDRLSLDELSKGMTLMLEKEDKEEFIEINKEALEVGYEKSGTQVVQ